MEEQLEALFPNICPDFLKRVASEIGDGPCDGKVSELLVKVHTLPTREEYEERGRVESEIRKWNSIAPRDFLQEFDGDPVKYYFSEGRKAEGDYLPAAVMTLKNKFKHHRVTEIESEFNKAGFLYAPAFRQLKMKMDRGGRTRSSVRRVEYQIPSGDHLYLMKEVRFCDLMDPIIGEQRRRKPQRKKKREWLVCWKNVSAATALTFFQQT